MKKTKSKVIKKWIKGISLISSALAMVATAGFTIAVKTHKNNVFEKTNNLYAAAASSASSSTIPDYDPGDSKNSPETIYMLDAIKIGGDANNNPPSSPNSIMAQSDVDNMKKIVDGLKALNVSNDRDIFKPFMYALANVYQNIMPDLMSYPELAAKASAALAFFTDPSELQTQFNNIQGFGTNNTDTLNIFSPSNIYSVFKAGQGGSINPNITAQKKSDVKYKLAEIDMKELKDQDKILTFKVSDKSKTDFADHDYRFTLNNKTNALYDTLNGSTAGSAVTNAFSNSNIILRDFKKIYDQANPTADILDKFYFDYKPSNEMLSIYAKPDSTASTGNLDINSALTFIAADADTKSISKTGILDVSLAPMYQASNYLNGNAETFIGSDQINSIQSHKLVSNQILSTAANPKDKFSFWLGTNESMDFSLSFQGDENIIENGNTTTLTFDGTKVTAPGARINLAKGTKIGPASFDWHYSVYKINQDAYAKVDLKVDGSDIKINKGQNITIPGIGERHIFWENPGNGVTLPTPSSQGDGNILFQVATDVADQYINYLGYTYGNWLGMVDKTDQAKARWIVESPDEDITLLGGQVVKSDMRDFAINYTYYKENSQGGIEGPISKNAMLKDFNINNTKQLLMHDKKTGVAEKDTTGKPKLLGANGQNTANLLIEYYKRYHSWLDKKFKEPSLKAEDYYTPSDPSGLGGWVITHILNNAPIIGNKIKTHADILVRLAYQGYNSLAISEKDYIDNLDDVNSPEYNWLGLTVKHELDNKIGNHLNNNTVDWTAPEVLNANKIVLLLLEKDLVKAIAEVMANETTSFKVVYSALLGKAMSLYLDDASNSYDALSSKSLRKISDSKLDKVFQKKGVLTMAGEPKIKVSTGKKQLGSLVDFIYNFGLQNRYLPASDVTSFNDFYQNGLLTDPKSYSDKTKRSSTGAMISLIDKIVNKVINKDEHKSLTFIINQMEKGELVSSKAKDEIANVLNYIINKIANPIDNHYKYKVLNITATSSYIKNLIIGRNLEIVLDEWIKQEQAAGKLNTKDANDLRNLSMFDTKTITNIAVGLGYYNLTYFIQALSSENLTPKTLVEILHSQLDQNIRFEIPKSNSFIDFVSNPYSIVKYGMLGIGTLTSMIGVLVLALSLKRGTFEASSVRAKILIKVIGISVLLLGIVIGGVGFILPAF